MIRSSTALRSPPAFARRVLGSCLLAALAAVASLAHAAELRFRTVEGAGGVPLNVVEAGDASKPGVLLIHGIGQSYLSFDRQLDSPLADQFHLVAMDLRGHGNSGKPWTAESYRDTATWAEDVKRVMAATGLVKPVILGWSYGTLVTADYVRHVGTGNLSGIVLVGALGGFTPPPAAAADPKMAEAMARNRARQSSRNLEEFFASARTTLPQLTGREMPPEWRERTMLMMAMIPPYVRAHMWLRNTNNVDIVGRIDVPLLIIGGGKDLSVPPDQAKVLAAQVRQGRYENYPESGHSPFAEEPERFNADLAAFAKRVTGAGR